MLEQGLTNYCWVLLKAATDVKALSVAVEKTAGTIAAVENAWLSSIGDACSIHLKVIMEGRTCHHQNVAAQHAGLVPDGTGGKCQGVRWGGQGGGGGDRGSAEWEDRTSSLGQQKLYSDGLVYGFIVGTACSLLKCESCDLQQSQTYPGYPPTSLHDGRCSNCCVAAATTYS